MFKAALLVIVLIAGVSADALVTYTWSNGNCNGNPSSASGYAIGNCISQGIGSFRITGSGNSVTRTAYSSNDCTGGNTITTTSTTGECAGLAILSTKTLVQSAFNPAPTASDSGSASYRTANCGGSPFIAAITYNRNSGTTSCSSVSNNGTSYSTQTFAGNNAPFPNSASTYSFGFFVIVAVIAMLI